LVSFGTLVRALRAPSLSAAAITVIAVTALVAWEGHAVNGLYFALTFVGLLSAQGSVNLINDYFDDASGLDADPEFAKNPFPLGSRVIQTGALGKRGVAIFAAACAALAFLALPVALRASQLALSSPNDPRRMTAAFASVLGLHFASGLLLAGGLWFSPVS